LEPLQPELDALGASLVCIAAQKRGGMFAPERYLAEHPSSFPYLLDEDRRVTKAYGVYHRLGVDAIHIARPATFIVDTAGLVQFIFVGSVQTEMASLGSIGQELKRLRPS
jgi:peroxiredoxin